MFTYLYIDESGNLGIKSKDPHFIISAIKVNDEEIHKKLQRIPKKIRQKKLKKKLKQAPEIKFSNSNDSIRKDVLKEVSKLDVEVFSVIIDKRLTRDSLQEKLMTLYNYLLKILLEKALISLNNNFQLKIILDRCMNKAQRDNFESYIESEFLSLFQVLPKVEIIHENSQNEMGLQVVDFISGAFGYKYNSGSKSSNPSEFTDIIKNNTIVEKNNLFKNKF